MTPMPLFCVRSISYVRAYNTNERNTYTNNPDPTDSTRRHSPIKQWYFFLFLQVEVPFLSITVFSIRRLMFSSGVKPGKTCRQHRCFLLDCRCFRFWRTYFRCFNCCFRFNGGLYNSWLGSLCCDCWNSYFLAPHPGLVMLFGNLMMLLYLI